MKVWSNPFKGSNKNHNHKYSICEFVTCIVVKPEAYIDIVHQ